MHQIPRHVLSIARTQIGLVRLDQLTGAGLSDRARAGLLRAGTLVPVSQGLYRLASHAETFEQRCLAACLATPGVLSGPTAGRLYGLRRCATDDVHVLAGIAITMPGIIAHRTNLLHPGDVTERALLRILRPARLVCDLAVYLSDDDLDSVIEQVLQRRLATLPSIRSCADRFRASGRNGTQRLARVLNGRPSWTKPPESDLERRVLLALHARGVAMIPQFELQLDGGRVVRLDMADPSLRLAVEVDHATWHAGRLAVVRDKRRDRAMMRLGWLAARVTDDDIEHRFSETIDQLVAIAETRRVAS